MSEWGAVSSSSTGPTPPCPGCPAASNAVCPDTRVDPDEDPRDSGGACPDGERAALRDYPAHYRLMIAAAGPGQCPRPGGLPGHWQSAGVAAMRAPSGTVLVTRTVAWPSPGAPGSWPPIGG